MKKNILGILIFCIAFLSGSGAVLAAFPQTFTNWVPGTIITSAWLNAVEQLLASSTSPLGSIFNQATTTGNILAASSSVGWKYLSVGSNGKVLTASSTANLGISWETVNAGFTDAATTTSAGVFTVSTTTTKITITIPPAKDQYFAPSTTIATNNNQLTNGSGFVTQGTVVFPITTSSPITVNQPLYWTALNTVAGTSSQLVSGATSPVTISAAGLVACATCLTSSNTGVQTSSDMGVLGVGQIPFFYKNPNTVTATSSLTASTSTTNQFFLNVSGVVSSTEARHVSSTIGTLTLTNALTSAALPTSANSSSISFNIYDATTTSPYSFAKWRANVALTIQSMSCDEKSAATTTVEIYKVTGGLGSVANGGAFTTSIPCGVTGATQNATTTSAVAAGDFVLVNVTSTAGTPQWTVVNISYSKN